MGDGQWGVNFNQCCGIFDWRSLGSFSSLCGGVLFIHFHILVCDVLAMYTIILEEFDSWRQAQGEPMC